MPKFELILLKKCASLSADLVVPFVDKMAKFVNKRFLPNCFLYNLHYTRWNTPKRVTSGGAHLRGLAPGLHSSEETSQRWRAVGDTVPI